MARTAPRNAEPIYLSKADRDVADRFVFRRSYNKDGSIRFVQAVGIREELEAAAANRPIDTAVIDSREQTQMALSRLIAQRMIGRPLEKNEVVTWRNGNRGDLRRENLEVRTRSEVARDTRPTTSSSGVKYVYPTESGRFAAAYLNTYLGTYNDTEQAAAAVAMYLQLVDEGVSSDAAVERVKEFADKQPRQQNNVIFS